MTTTTTIVIAIIASTTTIVTRHIGIVIATYIAITAWIATFLLFLTTFLLLLVLIGTYGVTLTPHF